jgi:hypothetical protein
VLIHRAIKQLEEIVGERAGQQPSAVAVAEEDGGDD